MYRQGLQGIAWWSCSLIRPLHTVLLHTSVRPTWPLNPDLFLSLSLFLNPHQSKLSLTLSPCVGVITVHIVMTWIFLNWRVQMMERIRMRFKLSNEASLKNTINIKSEGTVKNLRNSFPVSASPSSYVCHPHMVLHMHLRKTVECTKLDLIFWSCKLFVKLSFQNLIFFFKSNMWPSADSCRGFLSFSLPSPMESRVQAKLQESTSSSRAHHNPELVMIHRTPWKKKSFLPFNLNFLYAATAKASIVR